MPSHQYFLDGIASSVHHLCTVFSLTGERVPAGANLRKRDEEVGNEKGSRLLDTV
jgi:hypothetical protein